MRALGVVVAVLAAIAAAGCGGGGADGERSALALKLAALCDQAQADIQELGRPQDEGFRALDEMATIGLRLASTVRTLEAESDEERAQVGELADSLEKAWKEIQTGYGLYELGNAEGLQTAVEQGLAELDRAGALATRLGAPECAEPPFAELPAISR